MNEPFPEDRQFFSTSEVLKILNIEHTDLYPLTRAGRSKGTYTTPIFQSECKALRKMGGKRCFTQKDINRLAAYFKVYRRYQAVTRELEIAKEALQAP